MTTGRIDTRPAPPEAGPQPRPGWGERLRAHRTSLLILLGLLVVVGVVHAVGMSRAPQRVDDEGTYVAQAWAVQHWRASPTTPAGTTTHRSAGC